MASSSFSRTTVLREHGRRRQEGIAMADENGNGNGNGMHPRAMALPPAGFLKEERGRYGPIFPKTPANYGFTIIAKIKPGREQAVRDHGKVIEKGVAENPSLL